MKQHHKPKQKEGCSRSRSSFHSEMGKEFVAIFTVSDLTSQSSLGQLSVKELKAVLLCEDPGHANQRKVLKTKAAVADYLLSLPILLSV